MSRYSGKCDIYDVMMMCCDNEELEGLDSLDQEMKCFNKFKKRTNGTLYKHKIIKLTKYNMFDWEKYFDNPEYFSIKEHKVIKEDKRCKDNKKETITYSFIYLNKEYKSLAEINKEGFLGRIEIKFNHILDLIPYYPYIVSMSARDQEKDIVYISDISYVEEKRVKFAPNLSYMQMYTDNLQNHYIDIINRFYKDEERAHDNSIDEETDCILYNVE